VAKSLAKKMTTKIIGLLFPADSHAVLHNQFFIDILVGISNCAQSNGYYIMNAYEKEDNNYSTIQKMIKSGWVDGIILTTVRENDENLRYVRTRDVPHAVIGTPHNKNASLWVDNDNKKAMFEVTNKMIHKGYKKIAFISGDMNFVYNENRLDGYRNALREKKIRFDRTLIRESDGTFSGGYNAMKNLMETSDFDCVLTTDDVIAFGAIDIMNEMGIRYPLTGFNNTPMCEYVSPKLTSVDIRAEQLGYDACMLLIKKLEKSDVSSIRCHKVDTFFVERESTE
jgi:DNA-binding LacI/PurR family transcriptional regulator